MISDILQEYEQLKLSKEKYNSSSSVADITELKNSVRLVNSDTILLCNPKYPTLFQVMIFFDRIEELTKEIEEFYIVVGANQIKWPSTKLNLYSRKRYKLLNDKLIHVSIISGYSPKVNLIVGFFIDIIFGKISVSMHLNIRQALEDQENIRKQLNPDKYNPSD